MISYRIVRYPHCSIHPVHGVDWRLDGFEWTSVIVRGNHLYYKGWTIVIHVSCHVLHQMIFITSDHPMYYMHWCCITSVANTCITCVGLVSYVLVLHYNCVTADHEPVWYKGSHVWHGADSCIAKSCISNMRLQLVRSNQARTNCLTKHGLILIIALQSMPAAPKKPLRAECQDARFKGGLFGIHTRCIHYVHPNGWSSLSLAP